MNGDTITVRMPDGTLVQNVPRGTKKDEVMRRYNLLKEKQSEPKGFTESVFAPLGVKGPREAGSNIAETAKIGGEAFGERFRHAYLGEKGEMPKSEKFKAGLGELISGFGQGAVQWFADLGSYVLPAFVPGGAAVTGPRAPLSRLTSPAGGQEYARIPSQVKRGDVAGAAGSATAGLLQTLAIAAPELIRFKYPTLKAIGHGAEMPMREGGVPMRVPVTRGALKGGTAARVEQVGRESLGGGYAARAGERVQAGIETGMGKVFKAAATEEGINLDKLPTSVSDQAKLLGTMMRHESSARFYAPLDEAMNMGAAAKPVLDEVAAYATRELENQQVKGLMVRNHEAAPAIKGALEQLQRATEQAGVPIPESTGEFTQRPATIQPTFQSVEDALRNVKGIGRKYNLLPADQRILSELISRLDRASVDAVRKTLGADGVRWLQEGRRLTRRGWAVHDFGAALEGISSSLEGETSVPGAKPLPRTLDAGVLRKALEDLAATEPVPEGKERFPSRLEQAFPTTEHRATLNELAKLLIKLQSGGGLAPKFGILGMQHAVGREAVRAAGGGGPVGSILSYPIGIAVSTRALASPVGARLLLRFLQAVPNSLQAAQLANTLVRQYGQNGPKNQNGEKSK